MNGWPREDPRQRALVLRLELVVELVVDPRADLLGRGLDVEAGRDPLHQPQDDPEVLHVGPDRGGDARVLDLDRDLAAVVQPRAVDLADRGGGDRLGVELGEVLLQRRLELGLDHLAHAGEADLRRRVAQLAELALELLAVLLGHQPDVEEAHHLPELHRRALHRPERGHDLLGGLDVAALERGAACPPRSARGSSRACRGGAPPGPRRGWTRARCGRSARSGSCPWPLRASASGPPRSASAWPSAATARRDGGVGVASRSARWSRSPSASRSSPPARRSRSSSGAGVGVASSFGLSAAAEHAGRAVRAADRVAEDRELGGGDDGGADHGGQQAGDDRELPREARRAALLGRRAGRTDRPRGPQRPLGSFAARADAGRLLRAHRGAGRAAPGHARGDLRDHLRRAVQRLRRRARR